MALRTGSHAIFLRRCFNYRLHVRPLSSLERMETHFMESETEARMGGMRPTLGRPGWSDPEDLEGHTQKAMKG